MWVDNGALDREVVSIVTRIEFDGFFTAWGIGAVNNDPPQFLPCDVAVGLRFCHGQSPGRISLCIGASALSLCPQDRICGFGGPKLWVGRIECILEACPGGIGRFAATGKEQNYHG